MNPAADVYAPYTEPDKTEYVNFTHCDTVCEDVDALTQGGRPRPLSAPDRTSVPLTRQSLVSDPVVVALDVVGDAFARTFGGVWLPPKKGGAMNLDRVRDLADAYEAAIRQTAEHEAGQGQTLTERLAMEGFAAILAGSRVMTSPPGRAVAVAALRDLTKPVEP